MGIIRRLINWIKGNSSRRHRRTVFIDNDTRLEMLRFFTRSKIEAFELVDKRFRNLIQCFGASLPLRKFYEVGIAIRFRPKSMLRQHKNTKAIGGISIQKDVVRTRLKTSKDN